jgi:hypothetical protein
MPFNSGVIPITTSTETPIAIAAAGSYDVVLNNVTNPCKVDIYLATGGANVLQTVWLESPSKYNTHIGGFSVIMPAAGTIYLKVTPVTVGQTTSVFATVQGYTTP